MRCLSLRRLTAQLIVALASSSSLAHGADDDQVNLTWSTPERADCPDASYVQSEIRRYVGDAPARPPVEASANVRSIGLERWQLQLTTKDGAAEGERTLQGESCRAVADAAVVVLAWMVDPDAMANRLLPPPPPPPPSAKPPPPVLPRAPRPSAFFGLGMTGDLGTLPFAALGAEARAGVSMSRWRLAVHGAYWPTQRQTIATLPDGTGAGASFDLRLVAIEACVQPLPRQTRARFGFSLCAGPELDQIRGAGFGVNAATEGSKTWLSLSAALAGRVPLSGGLGFVVNLASVFPTEREHFALQGVGELYRPAALAGRASIGLELEL